MRAWLPLLLCPLLSGCFGLAFPSITETPLIAVPEDNVHAFRVTSECTAGGPLITGPISFWAKIEEIPIDDAKVAPQKQAYLAYSYFLFPFMGYRERNLQVLLYRPGFETVVLSSQAWWRFLGASEAEQVEWKPAPDLAAQVWAIKSVVDPGGPKDYVSKAVLQFAAREYKRLAHSPLAETVEVRDKLLAAARECEELAAKRTK
jgi:hypothetical protein